MIIGAGGLGSNSANILARVGVQTVSIVDNDNVSLSNLHRTAVFDETDIGKSKSKVLEQKLSKVNTTTTIKGIQAIVDQKNIYTLVKDMDLILDGTDSMKTRFLINDVAVQQTIPWVYAGLDTTTGMSMGIIPRKTPCLQCISHTTPQPSKVIPVMGNLPMITAGMQCTEAIKLLTGQEPSGLIVYDSWKQRCSLWSRIQG